MASSYNNKFARLNSIDKVEVMKTKREKLEHFYKVNRLVGKVYVDSSGKSFSQSSKNH